MKKRLLSILLVLTMVLSLVPAMSITASAKAYYQYVGDVVTAYIYGNLNAADAIGNIKDITIDTDSDGDGKIISAENGTGDHAGYIVVSVKGTKAGDVFLSYKRYENNGGTPKWITYENTNGEYVSKFLPTIHVGKTCTFTIKGAHISTANEDNAVKGIVGNDYVEVTKTEEIDGNVVVTVTGLAIGDGTITFDIYQSSQWEESNTVPVARVIGSPAISVGSASGTLNEGKVGTVSYAVTAQSFIEAPETYTVTWVNQNNAVVDAPAGVTVTTNTASCVEITTTADSSQGNYCFYLSALDDEESISSGKVSLDIDYMTAETWADGLRDPNSDIPIVFTNVAGVGTLTAGNYTVGSTTLEDALVMTTKDGKDNASLAMDGTTKVGDILATLSGYSFGGHMSYVEVEGVALGTELVFNYAFASCEFNQDPKYNDSFALLVSVQNDQGNWSEYKNIAIIPGTDPGKAVNIQNLKDDGNGEGTYWYEGEALSEGLLGYQYYGQLGYTPVFQAKASNLIRGNKFRVLFAICDISDSGYDSVVIIEKGSFSFSSAAINYQDENVVVLRENTEYTITFDDSSTVDVTSNENGEIPFEWTENQTTYSLLNKTIQVKEKGSSKAPTTLTIAPRPPVPDAPSAPATAGKPEAVTSDQVECYTDRLIVAIPVAGQEYSVDNGATWQKYTGTETIEFTGLTPNTEYHVITRIAATDKAPCSLPSPESATVKTQPMLKNQTVTLTEYSGSYDGQPHGISVSVSGVSDVTVEYSTEEATNYSSINPTFTDAGEYTVYYRMTKEGYYTAYGSGKVTITKADQTVSAPTEASKTVSSVTLTAAAAGQGDTYYAKSTENTKPTADSAAWQTGTEFTGLSMNTQYYFFVKYAGNSNYNAAISEGTAITTANHAHAWGYSLKSGTTDTIEASCTGAGTCDSTANKTLTIVAPTSPTYDGTAKAASIKDSKTSLGGLTTLPDIQYQKKTGDSTYDTATTTAPTAAGTYRASITVDTNKTAYVEYTIAPKQLTIGGTTVGNKTYDGSTTATATAGTLDGVVSGDTGNVTVSIQSAEFADKNAGTAKTVTIKYSISGTAAANYLAPVDDSSFSADISQKQLTISTESGRSTTVSGRTYDGTTTATATIGTVIGIATGDSVTVSVGSATFDTKDVGTNKSVAVAYKISGTDAGNYEKPVDDTKTASITAKPINVTANNKNSYVGFDLVTLTYTVDTTTPLVSGEALTGALATNADKDVVGSAYQITQGTLTNANNTNYSINFTAGTYTVKALETQTLSFPDGDQTKTYGAAAFTKTISGACITVTYESSDPTVATVNSATGEVNILKVGTTTITAKAEATATYASAEASYTLTVNNASQNAPSAGKTDETIKGKADGKLTAVTDAMEYRKAADSTYTAITGTEVTGLAAGDYKVRYAAKANYDASPDQTLTIAEGSTFTLTFDAKGGTAADQIPGLTWQATVTVPETTKTGYTFQEWNTNEAGTDSKLTAATKIEASDTYYAIWQANSYTVTFHENNGTGTMEPQTFVYDAAQSLTANAFTRSGFNFIGWASTPGTKYAEYLDGAAVKNLTAAANGNVDLYAVWTENPVYSVSGRVQQEEVPSLENVPNALVELKQGRNVIASTHTDSNGDYAFTGIESGEYNIVVTGHASGTKDKTKTTLILLEGENKTGVNVLLPQGDISSVVEVTNNTPQILAGGLDEEAVKQAGSNLTDTIRLILTVESVEDVTSTPGAPTAEVAAQTAIKQEASGKTVDFIDMDITKYVNAADSTVHETDTVLEIIVPYQTEGRTDITVYRFHDADGDGNLDAGQQIPMTKLNARPTAPYTDSTYYVGDGFIAIYTKFFSAYAIGYRTTSHGGIGGGTTTYTITGEDTGNEKLTVSTKTSAPGKEITITVKPDEGYQLTKLTLTDEVGNAIALTKVNETTYTFIMPASDVTMSAVFTKAGKCPQDNTCVYAKFTDSDPKAWYHPGVHFCVEKGYMVGISDKLFAPSGTLSRAMIVTMLWRMEGSPVLNYAMSFKDVAADQWYTEAIRWAQSTGVVKGYDADSFGPNDNVTREQLAAILMRYAAFKGIDVSKRADLKQFTDVKIISDWALENVKWANAVGLINGRTETTIVPTGNATRAEAANMVQRFCETVLK